MRFFATIYYERTFKYYYEKRLPMKNMYDYDKLLCNTRRQCSSMVRASNVEDFYSDRSRIIYCSSFRRLQHKAQVVSLEPNSSVRTRLTHSLEVADIGRTLANKI